MDTRNSPIDVPHIKLAKVGKDRDRKRGGAWLGARSASSFGGAGAGAGDAIGAGMSMSKLLMVLLVSGGASFGAWQMGNRISAKSATGAKPAAPRVFADKEPRPYADASGVVKAERSIPNSLGYVNNDGLTDEQRSAKRAAEDAASRKAAEDARIQADADAKKKAAEESRTASAPEPSALGVPGIPGAPAAASASALENAKKEMAGGKFGGMSSSLGGGGGALSGGAGLSGGISRGFGDMGGGGVGKGPNGVLSAFRSKAARPSLARASSHARPTSNRAKVQLSDVNESSRLAANTVSGNGEVATAEGGHGIDTGQVRKISSLGDPGTTAGPQAGPVPAGNSDTSNPGGGPLNNSGSDSGGPACKDVNYEPDANGNCTKWTETPKGSDATHFKGELNDVAKTLAGIAIASILLMGAKYLPPPYNVIATVALGSIITLAAIYLIAMGAKIAVMEHGDYVTGGIIAAIGTFVGAMAVVTMGQATANAAVLPEQAASETFKIAGEQLAAPAPALAPSVDSAAAASAVPGPISLPSPEGLGLLP